MKRHVYLLSLGMWVASPLVAGKGDTPRDTLHESQDHPSVGAAAAAAHASTSIGTEAGAAAATGTTKALASKALFDDADEDADRKDEEEAPRVVTGFNFTTGKYYAYGTTYHKHTLGPGQTWEDIPRATTDLDASSRPDQLPLLDGRLDTSLLPIAITFLDLSGCGLNRFPEELNACCILKVLDLRDNQITDLPAAVLTAFCANTKPYASLQLDLSDNDIPYVELPALFQGELVLRLQNNPRLTGLVWQVPHQNSYGNYLVGIENTPLHARITEATSTAPRRWTWRSAAETLKTMLALGNMECSTNDYPWLTLVPAIITPEGPDGEQLPPLLGGRTLVFGTLPDGMAEERGKRTAPLSMAPFIARAEELDRRNPRGHFCRDLARVEATVLNRIVQEWVDRCATAEAEDAGTATGADVGAGGAEAAAGTWLPSLEWLASSGLGAPGGLL